MIPARWYLSILFALGVVLLVTGIARQNGAFFAGMFFVAFTGLCYYLGSRRKP